MSTEETTDRDRDAWGVALEKYVDEHGGCVPVSAADFEVVGLIAIASERAAKEEQNSLQHDAIEAAEKTMPVQNGKCEESTMSDTRTTETRLAVLEAIVHRHEANLDLTFEFFLAIQRLFVEQQAAPNDDFFAKVQDLFIHARERFLRI